jgi:hypothetical protein
VQVALVRAQNPGFRVSPPLLAEACLLQYELVHDCSRRWSACIGSYRHVDLKTGLRRSMAAAVTFCQPPIMQDGQPGQQEELFQAPE